jgi:hypothetical protein
MAYINVFMSKFLAGGVRERVLLSSSSSILVVWRMCGVIQGVARPSSTSVASSVCSR